MLFHLLPLKGKTCAGDARSSKVQDVQFMLLTEIDTMHTSMKFLFFLGLVMDSGSCAWSMVHLSELGK